MALFTLKKGDDFPLTRTVTDDGTSSGSAVDLTSADITFKARRKGTTTLAIDLADTDTEISVGGASSNEITIDLTSTITDALVVGVYEYQLRIIGTDTEVVEDNEFEVQETL